MFNFGWYEEDKQVPHEQYNLLGEELKSCPPENALITDSECE